MATRTVIGVDIGGTKIRAGLVSASGKIVKTDKRPTEASKGRAAVLANVMAAIDAVWSPGVAGIGAGLAGVVDHDKGIYRQGPNFPRSFRNVPVAAILAKRYRVPASIDNDVHCFVLGEAAYGAGRGRRHVVGLTLGTGIGGGIVIDGSLYRGRHNAAGELGHMIVDIDAEEPCSCGIKGHFEALASGSAMARMYERLTGKRTDALAVEKAAAAGDARAARVLERMADGLAAGLANVLHALDPDVIVIGGGLSAVDMLWSPVRAKLRKLIAFPSLKATPIVRSRLGGDANVLGAALLALPARRK